MPAALCPEATTSLVNPIAIVSGATLVEHELLDDLIRPQQQRLRDRQAQRLGGLEIDDQFERLWRG